MPFPPALRRAAAAALLLSSTSACRAWRPQPVPAPGAAPAAPAAPMRVVLTDGQRVLLTGVTSTQDSLIGETGRPPRRHAVALRDVARVESREISAGRTAGAVAAGLAVATLGTLVLILSTAFSPPS